MMTLERNVEPRCVYRGQQIDNPRPGVAGAARRLPQGWVLQWQGAGNFND